MEKKNLGLDHLRKIVKEEVLKEMEEQDTQRAMHDIIVDITKCAAVGLKALNNLKSKALPTKKAEEAVSSALIALEHIFHDMSTNPTRYLDQGEPGEIVRNHLQTLSDRESSLRDNQEMSNGRPPVDG